MTYDQAAELLRISRRTLERRVGDGSIPVVRVGRRVLFRIDDLEAL